MEQEGQIDSSSLSTMAKVTEPLMMLSVGQRLMKTTWPGVAQIIFPVNAKTLLTTLTPA